MVAGPGCRPLRRWLLQQRMKTHNAGNVLLAVLALMLAASSVVAASDLKLFVQSYGERLQFLFDHLDPSSDASVAESIAAWRSGDGIAAVTTLHEYLATNRPPQDLLEAPNLPTGHLERAADATADLFHIQGRVARQPRLEDGQLDWNHRGPANDKEWAWLLNRHLYFNDLIDAWEETADSRYLDQLFLLWRDWLDSEIYPGRHTFSAAWRPLEVSRRILDSWPQVFFRLPDEDRRTLELRILVLTSLLEHGDALHRFPSFWGGNHLITEKTALVKLALIWPSLRPGQHWLPEGIDALKKAFEQQTYPDGAHKELTYHYQRVTVLHAQRLLNLLQAAGKLDQAESFSPLVESMWDYFIQVMRPDGSGPLNNASDLEWTGLHTEGVAEFFARSDWEYILSGGTAGTRPSTPESRFFPWSGHLVMRNGWTEDSDWAFFHLGPRGSAHDHDDHLHLSIFAARRHLLTDSGRYTYVPGPWRDYFKGPRAHNLMLVNGQAPLPQPWTVSKPMAAEVEITESFVRAKGHSRFPPDPLTGRGGARHYRTVYYQGQSFWIVVDQLITMGSRTTEILWHFHPQVSLDESREVLQLIHEPGGTVRSDSVGQESPGIGGFYSPQYNERIPRIQSSWTHRGSGPGTWIWLIQAPGEHATVTESRYDPDKAELTLVLYDGEVVSIEL